MKKSYLFVLFLLARCAVADDASPVDPKAILLELKQLEVKQSQTSKFQVNKILQDFSAASSSDGAAIAFYEQAVKATAFEGGKREQTNFQEWKKKDADKLKSMPTAARLHLQYLVLSLQRACNTPLATLKPALIAYTNQVIASHDELKDQELMTLPISDSLFVKWYGIATLFENLKDWNPVPGDVDGIFSTTLLPMMRTAKDPQLIQYWDAKLERGARDASAAGLSIYADQFNQITRPTLLWARAEDMAAIGQRNRAINEMLAIIKANPTHLSAGAWIKELSSFLNGAPLPSHPAPSSQGAGEQHPKSAEPQPSPSAPPF